MKDGQFTVGVTSIGSGIAQAVVNAFQASSLQARIIGFGNAPYQYGALDCSRSYQVPGFDEPDYPDRLLELCAANQVDLLIPGLDGDLPVLSGEERRFLDSGIEVLVAPPEVVDLCRDKYHLSLHLQEKTDVFVPGYLPEEFCQALEEGQVKFPWVAKPRGGSGSRGIRLVSGEEGLELLTENDVLQPLLIPAPGDAYAGKFQQEVEQGLVPQVSELSVQVIIGKDGAVLGKLATINKLKHGVPIEIFPVDREEIWAAVDQVLTPLQALGLRGPVNLQGRITGEGVRFFEVNPRFTGLSGTRAQFGFNGVEACLKSWLDLPAPGAVLRTDPQKYGLRQVADRAAALENNLRAEEYHQVLNPPAEKNPPRILLITGSTGYLGRNLIAALDPAKFRIWVLSTRPDRAAELHAGRVEEVFGGWVFQEGGLPWGRVDLLLHAGFARPHRPKSEIARSLEFTRDLFHYAGAHMVPALINISSQSIYGQSSPPPWDEDTPASPLTTYAAAKYAAELMLQTEQQRRPHLHWTSLRLAGLAGGAPGLVPVDLITRFVEQALRGEPLEILGEHRFERLDIRDAVQALLKLLEVPHREWEAVYNLGRGEAFSLRDLAETVLAQVDPLPGAAPSRIVTRIQDPPLAIGMDSTRFFQLTGWQPEYALDDTVRSLASYLRNRAEHQRKEG